MTFEEQLELGHLGERMVSRLLQRRGCGIVPSYDFGGKDGDKAPRLMFENRGLVLPDLDVCKQGSRQWAEVKTYFDAAWNKKLSADDRGAKGRHANDYLHVEEESGCAVFIFVLEVSTGWLLVARLRALKEHPSWHGCMCRACKTRNGRCTAPGITCGVFWDREAMTKFHRFGDGEMADLRAKWPARRAA